MPKNMSRGHREARKARLELPEVPNLGNLSMPRKGNRAAAKYVANVGALWDRRRVARKARKLALAREDAQAANPRRQHLDKVVRERMLAAMTGWSFDHQKKAFVPVDFAPERLEELIDAVVDLGHEPVTLRVSGLTFRGVARVRGYLGRESMLVPVDVRPDAPALASR